MTLAETYALACGVPLDRPQIEETFYPLEASMDKVILIHAFAGAIVNQNGQMVATFPAKIYDHFNEVVELLKPVVEAAGFKLYQIGGPGEPPLNDVESLVGKTSIHQCAYLVKNCALLIGNDSMWTHVAGAYNRPQVHIYGSTSKPHFPYWHHPASTFIESHRGGAKPTYSSAESPKTINWIEPETIVNVALDTLTLSRRAGDEITVPRVSRKSLYIGESYTQHAVEMVPDAILTPNIQLPGPLVIRMDYAKDWADAEGKLVSNARIRKCLVVTNREVNLNLLTQIKQGIVSIRVEVDTISPDWIKQVKKLGIQVAFFAAEPDPDKMRVLRLRLYQTGCLFDHYQPPTKDDFFKGAEVYLNKTLDKDIKLDTIRFKTRKFLLASNKVYLSKAHWLADRNTPSTDQNTDFVIDSPEFWEELPHFYLYHNE